MRRAVALARRAWPSPNPRVGAVIVSQGKLVGQGRHERAGEAHAEVHALRQAGEKGRGATAYVTLEPCSHHGKTGPCADALLRAGVTRVLAGVIDPNPKVAGKGIAYLRQAGVEAEAGVLQEECSRLIAGHSSYYKTGLPYVVWKYAMTLDGKVAARTGRSRWITGEDSRREVHRMRRDADAVVTGIGTALADDPGLGVRMVQPDHQPLRVIIDSRARLPLESHVLHSEGGQVVVIASAAAPRDSVRGLEDAGAVVLTAGEDTVDLRQAMACLADRMSVREVLLESGPQLSAAMVDAGLVHEVVCFVAPGMFGGVTAPGPLAGIGVEDPAEAIQGEIVRTRRFGKDLAIYARLEAAAAALPA